ncbi:hypothetical protein PHMEG_00041236 [Phytophthora megakarya]|uniref:Uncharacterized protein n=1 Tax=Phytophthora megakarya TaxID=4795 RepID=A0A225UD92_9STRA|nr:hypothetical protein PHMEG_00041236 [Phytophthora megakarya]
MFFPKEARGTTEWAKYDKVVLQRSIGSEYLNTYIPLVCSVFKCNRDVKFLTAAECPEKAYYMMKYATKDQNCIENPLAIYLNAYDKAQSRSAQEDDPLAAGGQCVQSMCWNVKQSPPHLRRSFLNGHRPSTARWSSPTSTSGPTLIIFSATLQLM